MAFHSKGSSVSRSARTSRRDKESILGLSGWLFADLLLAIAVIFLVVQDKPSAVGADPSQCDEVCISQLQEENEELRRQLKEIGATKSGLIASPDRQLTIKVPGGSSAISSTSFVNALNRSELKLGKDKQTFKKLAESGYRIGFVIWFARDTKTSNLTFDRHFSTFVREMHGGSKGLVADNQFDAANPGSFPQIHGYYDKGLGNDVFLRIFLFQAGSED